jgi:methylenetetrahydrofolate dehydrogenase (NADP+)/methenyltetrahydrofolate cyclohydrolase
MVPGILRVTVTTRATQEVPQVLDRHDKLISGRPVAAAIDATTRETVASLQADGVQPSLAIVFLGEHPDAASYRRTVMQRAARLGIDVQPVPLPEAADADALRTTLHALNADERVHGVLVQTPLPRELLLLAGLVLSVHKDVEGITPGNLGRLMLAEPEVLPCTAAAVTAIIDSCVPQVRGKRVVIVNNSPTVGRPLAQILLQRRATVTVCNTGTVDLAGQTRQAEILVVAIGKARFFGPDHVAPGALVIDVGINASPDGSGISGDVDTEAVLDRVSAITPVPGGVGPVTTAVLLANTVDLARLYHGHVPASET